MNVTPDHYDAAYYDANAQDGDRIALWFYARVAGHLAPRGARVLDFGCGVGHFARRLSRRFRTVATDHSAYARAATARTSPTTEVIDDTAAVADGTLDMVCTLHVLEHIPDPAVPLREFARMLRPGGRLLYVVPNPQGLGHRIKRERWFAYRDDSHCSLLHRDDWVRRTAQAGFAVDRVAADGLWDAPYVRRVPRILQLAVLGLPAAAQVLAGRAVLPRDWGECIIVTATRR